MSILEGKGTSVQLVAFDNGTFGVGVVFDNGEFEGTYYNTLEQAKEIFDWCNRAIENYFAKFGTRSE